MASPARSAPGHPSTVGDQRAVGAALASSSRAGLPPAAATSLSATRLASNTAFSDYVGLLRDMSGTPVTGRRHPAAALAPLVQRRAAATVDRDAVRVGSGERVEEEEEEGWLAELLSLSPENREIADRILAVVPEFLAAAGNEVLAIALIVAAATLIMGAAEVILALIVALGLITAASAKIALAVSAALLAIAGIVSIIHHVGSTYSQNLDQLRADYAAAHPEDPEPGMTTQTGMYLLALVNVFGLIDLGEALAGMTIVGGELTIDESVARADAAGDKAGFAVGVAAAGPVAAKGTRRWMGDQTKALHEWYFTNRSGRTPAGQTPLGELPAGTAAEAPAPSGPLAHRPAEPPTPLTLPPATTTGPPTTQTPLVLRPPVTAPTTGWDGALLPPGQTPSPVEPELSPAAAMLLEADLARWQEQARTALAIMTEWPATAPGASPTGTPAPAEPAEPAEPAPGGRGPSSDGPVEEGGGSSQGERPLTVVSNRGAFNRKGQNPDGTPRYEPAGAGGLVTGVKPVVQQTGGVWVSWHGADGPDGVPFAGDGFTTVPVGMSRQENEMFYLNAANRMFWPEMHDVGVPAIHDPEAWAYYQHMNRRYAEKTAEQAPPGSRVWTHDYQLMQVPGQLRQMRPDLDQGYFHHIPWAEPEVLKQNPWYHDFVTSLMANDLAGFHTDRDVRNFLAAAQEMGMVTEGSNVLVPEPAGNVRVAQVDKFPISIDYGGFEQKALRPEANERAQEIRAERGGGTILLGVDRLDYTKGIPERLEAYEQLLLQGRLSPEDTTFIQVATPSRTDIPEYAALKARVEAIVARINERFGTDARPPVHYHYGNIAHDELVAYYLAADVMIVNALRDGMNLVAMEYVTARHDGGGALVLSRGAGAADSLTDALLVDPGHPAQLQDAIAGAMELPEPERRRRMEAMRRHVREHDVQRWAREFLEALERISRANRRALETHRSRRR